MRPWSSQSCSSRAASASCSSPRYPCSCFGLRLLPLLPLPLLPAAFWFIAGPPPLGRHRPLSGRRDSACSVDSPAGSVAGGSPRGHTSDGSTSGSSCSLLGGDPRASSLDLPILTISQNALREQQARKLVRRVRAGALACQVSTAAAFTSEPAAESAPDCAPDPTGQPAPARSGLTPGGRCRDPPSGSPTVAHALVFRLPVAQDKIPSRCQGSCHPPTRPFALPSTLRAPHCPLSLRRHQGADGKTLGLVMKWTRLLPVGEHRLLALGRC